MKAARKKTTVDAPPPRPLTAPKETDQEFMRNVMSDMPIPPPSIYRHTFLPDVEMLLAILPRFNAPPTVTITDAHPLKELFYPPHHIQKSFCVVERGLAEKLQGILASCMSQDGPISSVFDCLTIQHGDCCVVSQPAEYHAPPLLTKTELAHLGSHTFESDAGKDQAQQAPTAVRTDIGVHVKTVEAVPPLPPVAENGLHLFQMMAPPSTAAGDSVCRVGAAVDLSEPLPWFTSSEYSEIPGYRCGMYVQVTPKLLELASEQRVGEAMEPLFCSLALYDMTRNRRRLTENFYFELNTDDVVSNFPNPDLSSALTAVFSVNSAQDLESVWLVLRIEKVLTGDDAKFDDFYRHPENHKKGMADKLKKKLRAGWDLLGPYRQMLSWGAVPLFTEAHKLRAHKDVPLPLFYETLNADDAQMFWTFDNMRDGKAKSIPGKLVFDVQCRPRAEAAERMPYNIPIQIIPGSKPLTVGPKTRGAAITGHSGPEGTQRCWEFQPPESTSVVPHMHYLNLLFVYVESLNLSAGAGGHSARNLMVEVLFKRDDKNVHSDGEAVWYTPTSPPHLTTSRQTSVAYHEKSPRFCQEMKMQLPPDLSASDHLLFRFYHISCKAVEESMKKDKNGPVKQFLGFAALHLYTGGHLLPNLDGYFINAVGDTTTADYLSASARSSYRYLGGDQNRPNSIFRLSVKAASTVYPQNADLNDFLNLRRIVGHSAQPLKTLDEVQRATIQGSISLVSRVPPSLLVEYFPVIANLLFTLLASQACTLSTKETALLFLVHVLTQVCKFCPHNPPSSEAELGPFGSVSNSPIPPSPNQRHRHPMLEAYIEHVFALDFVFDSVVSLLQWLVDTQPDVSLTHGWFFLDAAAKSLALSKRKTEPHTTTAADGDVDTVEETSVLAHAALHLNLSTLMEAFAKVVRTRCDQDCSAFGASVVSSCGSDTPTQLVVRVNTDLSLFLRRLVGLLPEPLLLQLFLLYVNHLSPTENPPSATGTPHAQSTSDKSRALSTFASDDGFATRRPTELAEPSVPVVADTMEAHVSYRRPSCTTPGAPSLLSSGTPGGTLSEGVAERTSIRSDSSGAWSAVGEGELGDHARLRVRFLYVFCQQDNYFFLNRPISFSVSTADGATGMDRRKSWRAEVVWGTAGRNSVHLLSGLFIKEVFIAAQHPNRAVRLQAITLLREILVGHDCDPRITQSDERRSAVGSVYLDLVRSLLLHWPYMCAAFRLPLDWLQEKIEADRAQWDSVKREIQALLHLEASPEKSSKNKAAREQKLADADRLNSANTKQRLLATRLVQLKEAYNRQEQLYDEERREWLACFLFVVHSLDSASLNSFFDEAEPSGAATFVQLLADAVTCFEYEDSTEAPPLLKRRTSSRFKVETASAAIGPTTLQGPTATGYNLVALVHHTARRVGGVSTLRLVAGNLSCFVTDVVLRVLSEFLTHFQEAVLVQMQAMLEGREVIVGSALTSATPLDILRRLFDVSLALLCTDQCERALVGIFGFLHRLVVLVRPAVFSTVPQALESCGQLTTEIIRLCNFSTSSIRDAAAGCLLFMATQCFLQCGSLALLKSRATLALSSLFHQLTSSEPLELAMDAVSNLLEHSYKGGEGKGLRRSSVVAGPVLSVFTGFGASTLGTVDESRTDSFVADMDDLCLTLKDILNGSLRVKQLDGVADEETMCDEYHKVAKRYHITPELAFTWYYNLAMRMEEKSHHGEAGMCFVTIAFLMARELKKRDHDAGHLLQLSVFHAVNPSLVKCALEELQEVDVAQFTMTRLISILKQAISFLERGLLYEYVNKLLSGLLIPLYEHLRQYDELIQAHKLLANVFTQIRDGEKIKLRMLGTYYRVAFSGSAFGADLDGREFVYREPQTVRLVEIRDRLEAFFSPKFPHGGLSVGTGAAAATGSKGGSIMIQQVNPYLTEEEKTARVSEFERNAGLTCFFYEQPFTVGQDGLPSSAYSTSMGGQWKRRTLLHVANAFPFLCRRQKVTRRGEIQLSPIENAIELLRSHNSRIQDEITNAQMSSSSLKSLQMCLQGSVRLQVNAGSKEIVDTFLHPSHRSEFPANFVAELQAQMLVFIERCRTGLAVHEAMVSHLDNDFHTELLTGFAELKEQVLPYLSDSSHASSAPDVAVKVAKLATAPVILRSGSSLKMASTRDS